MENKAYYISKEADAKLRALAKKKDRSVNYLIIKMVQKAIKHKKGFAAMETSPGEKRTYYLPESVHQFIIDQIPKSFNDHRTTRGYILTSIIMEWK